MSCARLGRDRIKPKPLPDVFQQLPVDCALGDALRFEVTTDRGEMLRGDKRIALARALFGAPALVVLDEPNASLDRDGEEALFSALAELKATGRTVVIIAHRPRVLQHVDRILVLRQGEVELLGPRDAVLARLTGVVGGEADTGAQIAPLKG